MKKLYWRPSQISRTALMLIALVSLSGLLLVEYFKVEVKQPYYAEKREATALALKAMQTIKVGVRNLGITIDPDTDPIGFGLIGELMTPITSRTGYLPAKQTTINPNFAGLVVDYLRRAQVREGDVVAVAVSGSFPALNICVYAALQTLKLNPVIIASASASQWGANNSGFSWLDMEAMLRDQGVFAFQSKAASIGGVGDVGLGMSKKGKKLLLETIQKYGISLIEPLTFEQGIDERFSLYQYHAGDSKISTYINVGGGTISVGRKVGKLSYHPGLNRNLPHGAVGIDSVMTRFSKDGVPVVHLIDIKKLAERYGFPVTPTKLSPVGEGTIYVRKEYNLTLAIIVLAGILVLMYVFIRSDLGYRIFGSGQSKKTSNRPEQMV